jgi:PAS domain S-box-containing protein
MIPSGLQDSLRATAPDHDLASQLIASATRIMLATLGTMALLLAIGIVLPGAPYHIPVALVRAAFLLTILALTIVVLRLRTRLAEHVISSQVLTRRLSEAQRVARLGYWEMDTATREVFWSNELYRIFGVDPAAGLPPTESIMAMAHADDRERMREVFKRAATDLTEYNEQYRFAGENGTPRILQSTGRVIVDETGARKLVGTVQDVTERHELESRLRQAQKMEAVGQLAGGVAHDFNNVLTVIDGYGALVAGCEHANQEIRSYAGEIRTAAKRAATLTRQLLSFSRKQEAKPVKLDLNETIAATSNMLHRLIGEHIPFNLELADRTEPIVADRVQIEQILINLAVNARDAMPSGGSLTIQTANEVFDRAESERRGLKAPGTYVRLSVADTGVGMDAGTKARIFEPFFTTKEVGKGTGLGLATVYGIVKQADGQIEVESEPGRGSTFTIYFPRAAALNESATRAPVRSPAPTSGGEWVMLVEDDEAVRPLAARVLRSSGYNVIEVSDGRQALELSQQVGASLSLVVADVMMPGLNGYEVAELIVERWPQVRVLFISGYAPEVLGRGAGVVAGAPLLEKPFTPAGFMAAVRGVLELREQLVE